MDGSDCNNDTDADDCEYGMVECSCGFNDEWNCDGGGDGGRGQGGRGMGGFGMGGFGMGGMNNGGLGGRMGGMGGM